MSARRLVPTLAYVVALGALGGWALVSAVIVVSSLVLTVVD